MSLTAAQIVTQATQIAKCPGYTSQAGQQLNSILQELAQTYDFDVVKGFYQFNFDPTLVNNVNTNVLVGSGPYDLPSDFLRCDPEDFWYYISGVPYFPIAIDLNEFDATVQTAGLQSYPYWYTVDVSLTPPGLYIYPPPSGAFNAKMRYRKQLPDISTPETSSSVPWFPNTNYLITRLAGELMKITDDERWQVFLGDTPAGAQGILNRYLRLKDDKETRSQSVSLDRRRFGRRYSSLPNTKTVGW